MLKSYLLIITLVSCSEVFAQRTYLNASVGSDTYISSNSFSPFWFTSNQDGEIKDSKFEIRNFAQAKFSFFPANPRGKSKITNVIDSVNDKKFKIEGNLRVINNNLFKTVDISEGFIRLKLRTWNIAMGRIKETLGDVDTDLSTGSLGVSRNALPIPKLTLYNNNYVNFPFTKGHFQFKGALAHGWLGDERFFKASFYHEKSLYLRLKFGRLALSGGLQHFGEWGGKRNNLTLDRSFKGFVNVLLVREARDGGGLPSFIRPGRAGDQRGLIELSAKYEFPKFIVFGYNQTPLETGIGVNIKNIDRLAGISFLFKSQLSPIKQITFEYLYSKQMESYGAEVHSYYNNGHYRTGWEYKSRVIGTPLFLNRARVSKFNSSIKILDYSLDDSQIDQNNNIVNNRVLGLHFGIKSNVFKNKMTSKTLITYTRNYGSAYPAPFLPRKIQVYTFEELTYKITSKLNVNLGIGLDFGDLYSNQGFKIGVEHILL